MSRITDHAYDAGPVNTGAPCIAAKYNGDGTYGPACGKFENEHRYSEYVDRNPSDMHEPNPYPGELDWYPIGNDSDNE